MQKCHIPLGQITIANITETLFSDPRSLMSRYSDRGKRKDKDKTMCAAQIES